MSERWLPVPGFEGLYEVSDEGRVRCLPRHRVRGGVLRPSAAGKGYLKVQLVHKQRHAHRYVHELVLTTFVGPRPPGMEVAHGNGKRDAFVAACLARLPAALARPEVATARPVAGAVALSRSGAPIRRAAPRSPGWC